MKSASTSAAPSRPFLETGKRLLVLRELFPKGNSQIGKNAEFEMRVEFLGFSKSTAYRFMQAATKTAKSANLALLSTQVKSASAFLELVTHDDDVLEKHRRDGRRGKDERQRIAHCTA